MAKIGMPLFDNGSMNESSTPACENGKGPSSLRQIQRGPWDPQPATAFCTAALASRRVESSVGSGEDSGDTSSGISVQPSTTASQPSSLNARIASKIGR